MSARLQYQTAGVKCAFLLPAESVGTLVPVLTYNFFFGITFTWCISFDQMFMIAFKHDEDVKTNDAKPPIRTAVTSARG